MQWVKAIEIGLLNSVLQNLHFASVFSLSFQTTSALPNNHHRVHSEQTTLHSALNQGVR